MMATAATTADLRRRDTKQSIANTKVAYGRRDARPTSRRKVAERNSRNVQRQSVSTRGIISNTSKERARGIVTYRIPKEMAVFQLMIAGFADFVQIALKPFWVVPFVGILVYAISFLLSVFVIALLIFWFKFRKVRVFFGKNAGLKVATFGITLTFELIPVLNLMPALTTWSATTIMVSRRADRRARGRGGKIAGRGRGLLKRMRKTIL